MEGFVKSKPYLSLLLSKNEDGRAKIEVAERFLKETLNGKKQGNGQNILKKRRSEI